MKNTPASSWGFTLIELLVVVLIIGILAAFALPQYQKAVTKSRATQLQTLLASVVQASNAYFLANGKWPTSFDDLDIDVGLSEVTSPRRNVTCGEDLIPSSVRRGEDFEIAFYDSAAGGLYHNMVSVHFITGKYKCAGFVHYNYADSNSYGDYGAQLEKKTFCGEFYRNRSCEDGCRIFCQQVMGMTHKTYIQQINVFE